MKIEKIHFNKIKVTFSPEDMIEHNITPEAVRDNAPWVQKVLMNVVHRAQEEMGFSAENARLMVEAMPGEGDSMVMYITKLESEDDIKEVIQAAKRKLRLKVRPVQPTIAKISCTSFDDFENAVRLSFFAKDINEGELYFFKEQYHLIIDADKANLFSEFGTTTTDEGTCDIIREHGKLVCTNALETLRNYF